MGNITHNRLGVKSSRPQGVGAGVPPDPSPTGGGGRRPRRGYVPGAGRGGKGPADGPVTGRAGAGFPRPCPSEVGHRAGGGGGWGGVKCVGGRKGVADPLSRVDRLRTQ